MSKEEVQLIHVSIPLKLHKLLREHVFYQAVTMREVVIEALKKHLKSKPATQSPQPATTAKPPVPSKEYTAADGWDAQKFV